VKDNHSKSDSGVLRGLHSQIEYLHGKLVRVTQGEVFDQKIDLLRCLPNFAQRSCLPIKNLQLVVSPGFAYAFVALSDTAEFL
jgi:dTDP-4-dehydrorhamnose 3,5-epimerase